jgi:hypothetical protein
MFIDDTGRTPTNATAWTQARCRNQAGQQFCAVSRLTTTVQQRL